ncbi:hypothetical protein OXX80_010798 [Metschnikowia pulcherrima]
MRLLAISFLVAASFSANFLHKGALYFTPPGILPPPQGISYENNLLIASQSISLVSWLDSGAIYFDNEKRYLSVDPLNKFVLSEHPDENFKLTELPNTCFSFSLSYKDENTFQLCEDLSFGRKSNCREKRTVWFYYEQDWSSHF